MHAQPDCLIKLAAAPKCEAEADARCVLASDADTPTKAPGNARTLADSHGTAHMFIVHPN